MNYIPLSVVVITFNEEANIVRCLQAIKDIADDIVVVDSYSTDGTVTLARALGARVVLHRFVGHIEQKNYAITQALHPFILSLDADELPDATLIEEIKRVKTTRVADGYSMNRLNNYCGQWIRHGAWYPDIKLRLWDSTKGQWTGMNPHDRFEMVAGSVVEHLKGNILHYSYKTLQEHELKVEYFSSIAATAYFNRGKRPSLVRIWFSPLVRFVRDYFIKLGFLDGVNGFRIAKLSAKETSLKYRKLRKLG